ncbi:MAG: DUF6934 family protein [Dyadobacter fermentans]
MDHERYELIVDEENHRFEFTSNGPCGSIKKMVIFRPLSNDGNHYNLAFGDWDNENQVLNDTAVSNNGDTFRILNTVAFAVQTFAARNTDVVILASGSTAARTRLYQINILKYWKEISIRFVVRGMRRGKWEPFKKGINYEAFLLFHK